MKKLGTTGLKTLKMCHLLFTAMWIGSVMALVSLQLGATPDTKEMMYMGVTIKENVIYAQKILSENISPNIYWNNIHYVAIAGIIQIVGFIYIIAISVMKPWKKNKNKTNTNTFSK